MPDDIESIYFERLKTFVEQHQRLPRVPEQEVAGLTFPNHHWHNLDAFYQDAVRKCIITPTLYKYDPSISDPETGISSNLRRWLSTYPVFSILSFLSGLILLAYSSISLKNHQWWIRYYNQTGNYGEILAHPGEWLRMLVEGLVFGLGVYLLVISTSFLIGRIRK